MASCDGSSRCLVQFTKSQGRPWVSATFLIRALKNSRRAFRHSFRNAFRFAFVLSDRKRSRAARHSLVHQGELRLQVRVGVACSSQACAQASLMASAASSIESGVSSVAGHWAWTMPDVASCTYASSSSEYGFTRSLLVITSVGEICMTDPRGAWSEGPLASGQTSCDSSTALPIGRKTKSMIMALWPSMKGYLVGVRSPTLTLRPSSNAAATSLSAYWFRPSTSGSPQMLEWQLKSPPIQRAGGRLGALSESHRIPDESESEYTLISMAGSGPAVVRLITRISR